MPVPADRETGHGRNGLDDHVGTAWRSLLELALARLETVTVEFREMGLSPGHIRSLLVLDYDQPRPMRWFAEHFLVDPSTVTWIVDRLEERGLVTRQPLEHDRRLKVIVLTAEGREIKARLEATLYHSPAWFDELPAQVIDALASQRHSR